MAVPKQMYSSTVARILDVVSYSVTHLWLVLISKCISCYLTATYEKEKHLLKAFHFCLLGPFLASLVVILFPFYIVGQITWICLCTWGNKRDFIYTEAVDDQKEDNKYMKPQTKKSNYTFGTANLLLGSCESLGKFQNLGYPFKRLNAIANCIAKTNWEQKKPLINFQSLLSEPDKSMSVQAEWPEVDFFLFQETWDRPVRSALVDALKQAGFGHFLVDVARHKWTSNYCTGNSGLMVASRYPILEAEFVPFKNKRSWQMIISYGVLMLKVSLDDDSTSDDLDQRRSVGFLANLHLMAYQEKENQIGVAMSVVQNAFRNFRARHTDVATEKTEFAVIAGDYNFDNISPGDSINHDHSLFQDYVDPCMDGPGQDHFWTVGTELRQLRMHDNEFDHPEGMRRKLIDDVERRHHVIDADIHVQTTDLMYCDPKPNSNGEICAEESFGGKRRIDRILFDPTCEGTEGPLGAAFITAFAGQTDHIPFALTLARKGHGFN